VTFAYSIPYTFTKLQSFLKSLLKSHHDALPNSEHQFVKESTLCSSLSGLDVPILTVSSRVHSKTFELIDEKEFTT
jgi:hypothetical protein